MVSVLLLSENVDWVTQMCNIITFLVSIVVSIPACHAGDPGSIPGRGDLFAFSIFHAPDQFPQGSIFSYFPNHTPSFKSRTGRSFSLFLKQKWTTTILNQYYSLSLLCISLIIIYYILINIQKWLAHNTSKEE